MKILSNIKEYLSHSWWRALIIIINTIGGIWLYINQEGNDTRWAILWWIMVLPIIIHTRSDDSDGHGGYA